MLTAKRLYLYGVLLVSLVLLLWGLVDLVRFALDELARAAGTAPAYAGTFEREALSLALALTLVAGVIFFIHLMLVRRTLRGPAAQAPWNCRLRGRWNGRCQSTLSSSAT